MGDGSNSGDYALPPPNFPIPDLSRPPPGFQFGNESVNSPPDSESNLIPKIPYFELPAGLMVPLIRYVDLINFKSIILVNFSIY
jgi:calcium homeostasis ER protein